MTPSVTLELASDFKPPSKPQPATTGRTLLLSPPSLSSHPEVLASVLGSYDRNVTDIQMLDRLSLGLVSLPESTYATILLLSDPDGTRIESSRLLGRSVLGKLVRALKPGGGLKSQDGTYATDDVGEERREAILAGLVARGTDGMAKPDYSATEAVPLRINKKKNIPLASTSASSTSGLDAPPHALNGKRKNGAFKPVGPADVGFVGFGNDLGESTISIDDDDELIDEDTLLDEEDMARPIVQRKFISCDHSQVLPC
jgi:anamorsin